MSEDLRLTEKITLLAHTLTEHAIPYAFGGALALAYYTEPRATNDIDINLFVGAEKATEVLKQLEPIGVNTKRKGVLETIRRDEQVRLMWGRNPLDLFFAYSPLHQHCVERLRTVSFGDAKIQILSLEDLAIFKTIFGRRKDHDDLYKMLYAHQEVFDLNYMFQWIRAILDEEDERFKAIVEIVQRIPELDVPGGD